MSYKLRSSLFATAALATLFLLPNNTLAASYHPHSMSRALESQGTQKTARATTLCGLTALTPPLQPIICEYAYIYNTTSETIQSENDVPFSNTGPSSSGITHAPGSSTITISTPGTYRIRYSAISMEPEQFAITVNGSVIPETTYEVGQIDSQDIGEALVTIPANSTITLRNHTSYQPVELSSGMGGTQQTVNASIEIEQVA